MARGCGLTAARLAVGLSAAPIRPPSLAYVLADPNVASAVVGATRMAHLLENLAASGMALDADTCDRIRAAQEDAR